MKSRRIIDVCKNAMGAVFLLAGAFFVCSTLVSIRAVFADPIAPVETGVVQPGTVVSASRGAANPRSSRATTQNNRTNARVVARTATAPVSRTANTTAPRAGGVSRGVTNRTTATSRTKTNANTARGVVSRTPTTSTRGVRARAAIGTDSARVSLTGNAIRGSRSTPNTSYTYLSGKLYTGNYSNIIDSTTGLISADAYSNCLDSYYTCMDEICTARNAGQGRCACAARAKSFIQAERALETANEELIKASGELALLIANKGKDVSAAFQLTDAEQVMNCVSWKEMDNRDNGGYKYIKKSTGEYFATQCEECVNARKFWCESHGIYNDAETCVQPNYCSTGTGGNNFGFNVDDLEGSSSDILATLQAWAESKEATINLLSDDTNNLFRNYANLNVILADYPNAGSDTTEKTLDDLTNTWGYELFEYAHNNVCSRVLDSCFNGIYEACGNPASSGRVQQKCANGLSSTNCPFNYNSIVDVDDAGNITLNERNSNSTATSASQATCYGYSSTDPYATLRGPVADARRSVMNKYLLDVNAACDAYGEKLRTTAQKIGYQKVAAQQSLQQKRLEFKRDEQREMLASYKTARSNFNECLSELYDCYTEMADDESKWSTSRIKTYCQQVANVPHCYEEMVCGPAGGLLEAVVDIKEFDNNNACNPTNDLDTNTCRNVLTLSEILDVSYAGNAADNSSVYRREQCLQNIGIDGVRNWTKNQPSDDDEWPDNTVVEQPQE